MPAGATISSAIRILRRAGEIHIGIRDDDARAAVAGAISASSAGDTISAAALLCACARNLLLLRKLMCETPASASGAIL
jgi:hypothetical protein